MAIIVPQGFDVISKELIDKRLVLSKADMYNISVEDDALRKGGSPGIFPDKSFALCKDDNDFYVYDTNNDIDPTTGKFRIITGVTEWERITGKPFNTLSASDFEVDAAGVLKIKIDGSPLIDLINKKVAAEKDARVAADKTEKTERTAKDAELEAGLTAHTSNTDIHITADERSAWNAKADQVDLDAEIDRAKAEEAKKVDGKIVDAGVGTSTIFNEKDGGGAMYEGTDGVKSFVGVNNGKEVDINAQLYSIKNGKGVKVDVVQNKGAFYTKGNDSLGTPEQRDVRDNELLVGKDIIDNLDSTAKDKALSANQGKVLSDRIKDLEAGVRFLAVWNCVTGLPASNPPTSKFKYKTGDFYRVGVIHETLSENLIPDGAYYNKGVSSTKKYTGTEPIYIGDFFYYDGNAWSFAHAEEWEAVYDVVIAGESQVEGGVATLGKFAKFDKVFIDDGDLQDESISISKISNLTVILNNKVDKETGKSLVLNTEIEKLATVHEGATKVETAGNGHIKINGVDETVYELQAANEFNLGGILAKQAEGDQTEEAGIRDGKLYTRPGSYTTDDEEVLTIDNANRKLNVNISTYPGNAIEVKTGNTGGGLYVNNMGIELFDAYGIGVDMLCMNAED